MKTERLPIRIPIGQPPFDPRTAIDLERALEMLSSIAIDLAVPAFDWRQHTVEYGFLEGPDDD